MDVPQSTRRGRKALNLTGRTFGRLTVIALDRINSSNKSLWLCRCECGTTKVIATRNLREGTKSCGCLQKERATRHGEYRSPEYAAWRNMIQRCHNPRSRAYSWYGGRGISVCQRWLDSFEVFLEDMGPRTSRKHSLDRIDNDGNYEPENCRWATAKEQNNNRRQVHLTFNETTLSIAQWSRKLGMTPTAIRNRLKAGWSLERTLTTAKRGKALPSHLAG